MRANNRFLSLLALFTSASSFSSTSSFLHEHPLNHRIMSDNTEPQEANDHHSTSSGSASEASGIIQQMQNLVDVESGLAEAHFAVETDAAHSGSAGGNNDEIAVDDDDEEETTAETAAAAAPASEFLQAAEKVEEALESAIAPAPAPVQASSASPATAPSASTSTSNPAAIFESTSTNTLPGFGSSSTHPTPAATEAQQAINAVNADIPAPVLPEQVAEPAHDVEMETAVEEETSPMQVDVDEEEEEEEVRPRYDPSEPQTMYDPSEPQTRYDPTEPQTSYEPSEPRPRYDPSEPQGQDVEASSASYDPAELKIGSSQNVEAAQQETVQSSPAKPNAADRYVPAPAGAVDPRQQAAPVKQETASSSGTPVQQYAPAPALAPAPGLVPAPIGRPLVDLPADITDQSPSVVSNGQLVNLWRSSRSRRCIQVKTHADPQIRATLTPCWGYLTGVCKDQRLPMRGHGTPLLRRTIQVQ
jgi:hypothetical protein